VSSRAKISGKLPDNGSHETLPAKAFLITEVMAIFDILQDAEPVSVPQNRQKINDSQKRVQTSRPDEFPSGVAVKKPSFRFQVNFDSQKYVSFE
jgi:hypothetical protein